MKYWWKALGYCIIALIASSSMLGAVAKDAGMEDSCRSFVRTFYAWYNAPSAKAKEEHSPEEAIQRRSSAFDPELLRQLVKDYDAQSKVTGEIVGLDMDPFLATNSVPYEGYVVGKIIPKADTYLAEIYGTNLGKKSSEPVVVPELRYKNDRWQFVNFHYLKPKFPENENLLSILKVLREEREKNKSDTSQ